MKKKRDINWELVRDDYVRSDKNLLQISNEHKLPQATVYWHSKQEGWVELRKAWKSQVSAQASEQIMASQVDQHIRIYEATRKTADLLVEQLMRAATDQDGLYRHVVQMEEETVEGMGRDAIRTKSKWAESKTLEAINGRNASDLARALKDLAMMSRTLDGIMDAAQRAKIDLERDKLSLDRRRAGMDDDAEQESGIAYITPRDLSLLDDALPDPDDAKPDDSIEAEIKTADNEVTK